MSPQYSFGRYYFSWMSSKTDTFPDTDTNNSKVSNFGIFRRLCAQVGQGYPVVGTIRAHSTGGPPLTTEVRGLALLRPPFYQSDGPRRPDWCIITACRLREEANWIGPGPAWRAAVLLGSDAAWPQRRPVKTRDREYTDRCDRVLSVCNSDLGECRSLKLPIAL